jgi:hypothetical protein
MANQTITQLPDAGPITGTELVPIVQNGGTYKTTTAAIANSPTQTQTFLTVNNEPTLPNSRYFSTDANFTLTDGGSLSFFRLNLTGAAASLAGSSNGIQVKTSPTTLTGRTLISGTTGLSIANGDGISGNPTFSLDGNVLSLANASGTGLLALSGPSAVTFRAIQGTASEIDVANGTGASADPVIGLADNPVVPGSEGIVVPTGNTASRPLLPVNGTLRYNSQTAVFEGYANNVWGAITTGTGVTSVGLSMPADFTVTNSPVTSAGVLTATWASQAANLVLASPNGSSGTPSFRSLANDDLPASGVVAATYGTASAVPVFTVNAKGVVTNVTNTTIAISNTQVSGLGTMSTQNATSVAITGGAIDGTTIGGTTPAAGTFTSVTMTSGTITTAPVSGNDIVNKTYADSIASGINFHQSCVYATTTALAANTYNNGISGVGATLTGNVNGALVIDGHTFVSPTDVGKRVLIKNEGNAAYNGVYTVTQTGSAGAVYILTRATDFDTAGSGVDQIDQGDFFLITAGTANANTSWVQQTPLPVTVGTTGIVFSQFGAPLTYSAGTGLNESPAYTFNIANTGVTSGNYGSASSVPAISVNAQGQITSATNTSIAIAASQVTSGSFGVDRGAVGITSYAAGDIIYANTTTSFDKLAIGAASRILTSTGSAPSWTDPSTITVGTATNATNATNVGVAVDSTNANYFLGIYSTNTGNLPTKVATGLTANPSTGMITGGISGGTF